METPNRRKEAGALLRRDFLRLSLGGLGFAALGLPAATAAGARGPEALNWRVSGRRHGELVPGLDPDDAFPGGVAALTFDDGPIATNTPALLDELREQRVRATFFVAGAQITRHTYGLVRRTLREGHLLGNHSYRHDVGLARLDPRHPPGYATREFGLTQMLVDIAMLSYGPDEFDDLCRRVVGRAPVPEEPWSDAWLRERWATITSAHRDLLGGRLDGMSPYRMIYGRPPGGGALLRARYADERERLAGALRELGLLHVLWHSSSGDSDGRLPLPERHDQQRLVGKLTRGLRRGGVILAHDRLPARVLRSFLRQVAARPGSGIVSLHDLIALKYGTTPSRLLEQLVRS